MPKFRDDRRAGSDGWTLISGLPMALFFAIPVVALLAYQPRATLIALTDPATRAAVGVSLRTTAVSLALTFALGTPLAVAVARSRVWLSSTLSIFVELPLVLPPAAAGVGLLVAFGRKGMLPTGLAFTAAAVVLAQTFVSAPIYILALAAAIRSLDPDVEDAAAIDGARSAEVLARITFPLVAASAVTGLMLAWARAVGEFGATILFAGNLGGVTQTMPLAIYVGLQNGLGPASGLAVILLSLAALVLFAARVVESRTR